MTLGPLAMFYDKRGYSFRPGVTAVQLRLQPALVVLLSERKWIFTVLVKVVMIGGWKRVQEDVEDVV